MEMKDATSSERVKFMAGYVAYRMKDKYTTSRPPDWNEFVARENLYNPSENLID